MNLLDISTLKAEELGSRRYGALPGSGVFIVYMHGPFHGSCFGKTSSQEYKIHGIRIGYRYVYMLRAMAITLPPPLKMRSIES